MAFFIPFTVECDKCKKVKTMKASSKRDFNRRLRMKVGGGSMWFADDNSHMCYECFNDWPFIQHPEYGTELQNKHRQQNF